MALIFIRDVGAGAGGDDGRDDRNIRRIFEGIGFRNRPGPEICPRCHSIDTKFCYYNNRSLAQPRYFCRRCRRYWTHGGVIRDVPVGGRRRRVASSSRQPGQIMLDSPLPTQLGGITPLTFLFGPMMNFQGLPGPMAEKPANVPGWNVANSVPMPPPPPPPQPQVVRVNHAENDDNNFMGSGEF